MHIHWLELNKMPKKDSKGPTPFLCFQNYTSIQMKSQDKVVFINSKGSPVQHQKYFLKGNSLCICRYRQVVGGGGRERKRPFIFVLSKKLQMVFDKLTLYRKCILQGFFLQNIRGEKSEIISEKKVENIHESRRQERNNY